MRKSGLLVRREICGKLLRRCSGLLRGGEVLAVPRDVALYFQMCVHLKQLDLQLLVVLLKLFGCCLGRDGQGPLGVVVRLLRELMLQHGKLCP